MSRRDRAIARRLTEWFGAHRRDLPWRRTRRGKRDPYRSLVSEAMLQQTQASRVAERFEAFIERFPTVEALAAADEQEVLAEWSGLGYYRRARSLHRAARMIVEAFGARVPDRAEDLLRLPGMGRYTAGAIASIVFGRREAVVDANVTRVALRVEGRELAASGPEAAEVAWERASAWVGACEDPGMLNEGLMELGALVCRAKAPRCEACPLKRLCVARREDRVDSIPAPGERTKRKRVHHACALIEDHEGRLLVERRPAEGLWASMWQAPTLEGERAPTGSALSAWLGDGLGGGRLRLANRFTFMTTHRLVEFHVWRAPAPAASPRRLQTTDRRWLKPGEIASLPLASPHRRVLTGAG